MHIKILPIVLLFQFLFVNTYSQSLLSDTLATKFYAATAEPDSLWNSLEYNDNDWGSAEGIHLFGYGDSATIETDPVQSIYVRSFFTINNKDDFDELVFYCEFDDGFVAYINGVEFARVNMGNFYSTTSFDQLADRSHEMELLLNNNPVSRYYIDAEFIENHIIEGENILSFEVHNDSINGSDLGIKGILYDYTNVEFDVHRSYCRYKKCVQLDSTTLPIIVIETDENGITFNRPQGKWIEVPATMGIISNNNGEHNLINDAFNDHYGNISIRYRGQSSANFPKRSYNIELLDDQMEDTSASLLGMPRESDWILQGNFADKSQIRNAMFYELARKTGNWTPRTQWCELIVNGEFVGLYNLIEKITRDSARINVARLRPEETTGTDLTGGYIFKFDKGPSGIQIEYPKEKNLQTEQEEYIRNFYDEYISVLKSNDGLDEEIGYKKYINEQSLIDYVAVAELGKNCDSYLYSSYMHKDRADRDNRIVFGPIWDFDLCMGNANWQDGDLTYNWQFDYSSNNRFRIKRLFEDTALVNDFESRWFELRQQHFNSDSLLNKIDELTAQLEEPLQRNYEVWPVIDKPIFFPAYEVQSYQEEVDYIKNWLQTRGEWIDNNIDDIFYEVTVYTGTEETPFDNHTSITTSVYPNPMADELFIDLQMPYDGSLKIELINIQGKIASIIEETHLSKGEYKVFWNKKTTQIESGLYILSFRINGKMQQHTKIIIEN